MTRLNVGVTAAAAAAAVMLAVTTAPQAAAYPKVTTLTPGAPIGTYTAAGNRDGACTAGWLARTADGTPMMLTAGHCFSSGAGGQALLGLDADAGNYVKVGDADYVVDVPDSTDIAVVRVTGPVTLDARVLERRPVSGVVAEVSPGDTVCVYGSESGRNCGPVMRLTDGGGIQVDIQTRAGDSGSPVYRLGRSGVAQPVGLVRGALNGDAVVQPIADVLRERELTLLQTESPAPHIQPVSHR